MLAHSIRPLLRVGARQATRHASSTSRTATASTSRYALLVGATAVVGALALTSERRRLWNDDRKHDYDEDLKTNRHKAAAQKGATPETPLHNTSTSEKSVPIPASTSESKPSIEKTSPPIPADLDDVAATEEQASQEGAFNEETGEINWDCPCLGGMAHGPCGDEFRAAFSCFVFSEQEPKGIDCVEKFKGMQDCFRKHPEIYGEEIDDDEAEVDDSPLTTTEVTVSTDGLDGNSPKAPVTEPPAHSPIPSQTHENNPSKGVPKLQPQALKTDKVSGAAPGDGTIS